MKIMKFGGSSVASADRIKAVVDVIRSQGDEQIIVVCSALGGVTDKLIEASELAAVGDEQYLSVLDELSSRHLLCANQLLSDQKLENARDHLQDQFRSLDEILRGIYLIQECTLRSKDIVMSFGERLSSFLVCEHLKEYAPDSVMLDASYVIKTDASFGNARVKMNESFQNIRNHSNGYARIRVATGFIASTDKGETTTIGRGGSDYTASLFGAALGASEIQIWTDVDGVLSADPRIVEDAQPVAQMSYEEAMELSHFGAKVIYPPTMQPALDAGIPIRIKNTFSPDAPGTLIRDQASSVVDRPVTGISSIEEIAFVRIHGSGLVGVTGTAGRMFSALARMGINIIMITQGSSEHSICFAVASSDAEEAVVTIREEFALQILQRQIEEIVTETDLSIIAVIGERMRQTKGLSGRLFSALGSAGVNVVAIAQGSSERNISIVVKRDQQATAIRAAHKEFFDTASKEDPAKIYLVGTGLIGSTLLEQIGEAGGGKLKIHGLANSKNMIVSDRAINPVMWQRALDAGKVAGLDSFVNELLAQSGNKKVFVDCTASDKTPHYYPRLISEGVKIVTPNKKAASGPQSVFDQIAGAISRGDMRHETNVGAGLPVISTIRSLRETGDEILEIQGVFSGTLSYLFNSYDGTGSFADLVTQARAKGYTEPDPRDDLSGMDLARKLVVIARELGMQVEIEDVQVENLTPEPCRNIASTEDFLERLKDHDQEFAERARLAAQDGKRLRYIGKIGEGGLSVSLEAVGSSEPTYGLSGSDNLIAIRSKRYSDRPLVIQGPGAGAQVTAAGVFADILSCIK
ncbi:MAG: bifunctional aspartate kinase/homoserine dehydrogenase I [Parcubacteria group bacterium]|nr:bifunctional aspartate kinase/homoserine dehydrogenase I [Parcubacteria group bacterium]